jgi:anti-sigma-K factor RskA
MTHEQYEDLVAAYAFDTADPIERQQFEAHLPTCASCRDALDDLRRVSAGLGLSIDPVEPPVALKARVMHAAVAGSSRLTNGTSTPRAEAGVGQVRHAPVPLGWRLALVASVLLAAGLATYAMNLRAQVGDLQALLTQVTAQSNQLRADLASARVDTARLTHTVAVIGAPDVIRVELKGGADAPGSLGRAYLSSSGVIFSARSLPTPRTGRTYQLWLIPPGAGAKPVDAGIFSVDPAGAVTLNVPMPSGISASGISVAAVVAVSEEPAGGSPTGGPTGAVVLAGQAS